MGLRSTVRTLFTLSMLLTFVSCGWLTRSAKHDEEDESESYSASESTDEPGTVIVREKKLTAEVQELRKEVQRLQDELAASHTERARLEQEKGRVEAVDTSAFARTGKPVLPKALPASSPRSSLSNNEPIQRFRDAMIRFDSEKYPEATVAFAGFLREYPDHALAGAAQFHLAESYRLRKEPKLALAEYQRVLVTYDRSNYVPETLSRLIDLQESMSLLDEAAENRQLLSSLYPGSPSARKLSGTKALEKKAQPPAKPQAAPSTAPIPEGQTLDEPPLDEAEKE